MPRSRKRFVCTRIALEESFFVLYLLMHFGDPDSPSSKGKRFYLFLNDNFFMKTT